MMDFNTFKKTEKKRVRTEWVNLSYSKVVSITSKITDFYGYNNRWYINLLYMFMFGCFVFNIMNGIDNTFDISEKYNNIILMVSDIYLIIIKISIVILVIILFIRGLYYILKNIQKLV